MGQGTGRQRAGQRKDKLAGGKNKLRLSDQDILEERERERAGERGNECTRVRVKSG